MFRMAAGTVIYCISGDTVFQICNTHGDSTSRTAAGAVIYVIFGDGVLRIRNTHGDAAFRIAKKQTLSGICSLARRIRCVFSVRLRPRCPGLREARRFVAAGP